MKILAIKDYLLIALAIACVLLMLFNKRTVVETTYDPSKVDSLVRRVIVLQYELQILEKSYLDTLAYYGVKDSIRQYNYEKDKKKLDARVDSIRNASAPTDSSFQQWFDERFPSVHN
jgi:ABC-type multidrug transport system ATPase subunit